jgi:cell shape-determining protein MreD
MFPGTKRQQRDGMIGSMTGQIARVWNGVWPTLSVVCVTVVAALPAANPHAPFSAAALMPGLAVHYWAIGGTKSVTKTWALTCAFGAGIAVDSLSGGPLGYWALVDLAMAEVALGAAATARTGWVAHAMTAAAALCVSAAAQGLLVLAYTKDVPDLPGLMRATLLAFLLYPLLALTLRSLSAPAVVRPTSRAVS